MGLMPKTYQVFLPGLCEMGEPYSVCVLALCHKPIHSILRVGFAPLRSQPCKHDTPPGP